MRTKKNRSLVSDLAMAIFLRRALISNKNLFSALRTASSVHSNQTFSYLNSSYIVNSHDSDVADRCLSSPLTDLYQFNTRRGFAKGRKQKFSTASLFCSVFWLMICIIIALALFYLLITCMCEVKQFSYNFEAHSFRLWFWRNTNL